MTTSKSIPITVYFQVFFNYFLIIFSGVRFLPIPGRRGLLCISRIMCSFKKLLRSERFMSLLIDFYRCDR